MYYESNLPNVIKTKVERRAMTKPLVMNKDTIKIFNQDQRQGKVTKNVENITNQIRDGVVR